MKINDCYVNIIRENIEIQLYGLKFMRESYSRSKLSAGWSEQLLVVVDNSLSFLLLSKDKQTGVWFFNQENDYVASNWHALDQKNKKLFYDFSCYFINHTVSFLNKSEVSELCKAVSNNKFFQDQILDTLKTPINYIVQNSLFGIIDDNFARSQIAFKNRNHICLQGKTYDFHKSVPLSNFGFCTLYQDPDDNFIIIFETTHFAKRVGIYTSYDRKFLVTSHSYENLLMIFLSYVLGYFKQLNTYFQKSQNATAILLRNTHIGHNLWNDLSVLYRLEKERFEGIDEVIFFGGKSHEVYGPIKELINIPCQVKLTYSIENNSQISDHIFSNNITAFRFGDDFIPEELAKRIISYSNEYYSKSFSGKTIIVLGLRFENRTWINQIEGLLEISRYLATIFRDLVIIVDGHDFIGHLNLGITSHMEEVESDLIKKEMVAFHAIESGLISDYPNVSLINSINNDIRQSISLISNADFFISPWGAGLAKYKWICNKPGIIFTNQWNLKNKGDLHIYDNKELRENAIPSAYLNSNFIADSDIHASNTKVPVGMEKTYSNFMVNIDGLKASIILLAKSMNLPILIQSK